MPSGFKGRLPYLVLTAVVVLLDQASKSLVLRGFELHQSITVIDGLFDITYVQNTGVAFSLFAAFDSVWKPWILSAFTGGAAVLVIVYSFKSESGNRLLQSALGLVLGGALGNLIDRVRFGYVVDFLEFYVGRYHWPTFNVADAAISTGVALLVLEMIRSEMLARPA